MHKIIAKILHYSMQYLKNIAILHMQYCTFWKSIAIPMQYQKKYCNIALQYFCNIAVKVWEIAKTMYQAMEKAGATSEEMARIFAQELADSGASRK